MAVGPSMRDAKMVKAPHESRMRAVAVAAVYGAGMYIDTERNSKRRECRTWRLTCATAPVSEEGVDAGVGAVGVRGTRKVWALGTGVDVGAGAFEAGTCAFVTATVAIRRCARCARDPHTWTFDPLVVVAVDVWGTIPHSAIAALTALGLSVAAANAALGAALKSIAHGNMLISRLRHSSPTRWRGA